MQLEWVMQCFTIQIPSVWITRIVTCNYLDYNFIRHMPTEKCLKSDVFLFLKHLSVLFQIDRLKHVPFYRQLYIIHWCHILFLIKTSVFGSWNFPQDTSVFIFRWNLWCSSLDGFGFVKYSLVRVILYSIIKHQLFE